jgi:RES domain-containing protein
MIHDIEIVDTLESLKPEVFSGDVWRTTWQGRPATLGGNGGGRWSVVGQNETLYASLEENTSIAELHYHLSKAPVFSSSSVEIHQIQARELDVLDLTAPEILSSLKVDLRDPGREQFERCQQVGAAVYFLGYQAALVPSYRKSGNNCVIFPERLENDQLKVIASKPINWPSWIDKNIRRN